MINQKWHYRVRSLPKRHILGEEEIQGVITKERMRSDRTGIHFSVVSLELRDASDLEEKILALFSILSRRLRITDEIGRVGPGAVAIVLPETPTLGAYKVADDVLELLPRGLELDISVYSYPSDLHGDRLETSHSPEERSQKERVGKPLEPMFAQSLPHWKRALDLLGASLGLVLLSPIMLAAALAVKLTSKGPVLFEQRRAGLSGQPFTIFKFRTMCEGAHDQQAHLREFSEQDGPAFKLGNDPRLTRVGRFLRRTSIDELPQLWNVMRGEMTLVGPRPLPCAESDGCEMWQRRRLDVTPGLTCIWQVKGRSQVAFVEWMRLDLEYICKRSWSLDLLLIFQTARAVLLGNGK